MPRTHLDAASGAPLHPAAREALLAALDDGWADPHRLYTAGRRARQLLDGARQALADGVGCRPDELVLLPSATQARYDGVRGVAAARARTGRHVVHSAIEHAALLHACAELTATSVGVDLLGRVSLDEFRSAVQPDTVLACLTAASHEVGTLQPVAQLDLPVPLLVDAEPLVGHLPVPEGWSLLVAGARGWGGGELGLLAVRTGTRWRPSYPETGELPVDLPRALAAAVGLQAVLAEREAEAARLSALVDRVRTTVAQLPDVEVVGDPVDRLPHLVTFTCLYLDGETLVRELDALGFAVSSGSSCTSSTLEPSHVLVAMGVSTHGSVRLSLSRSTTEDDVRRFLAVLPDLLARLRAEAGL